MTMSIRLILWKFTWNLLHQEDLLRHRELNSRLRILISTCSRNRMFPRLSLLFRFRNIRSSDPETYVSKLKAKAQPVVIQPPAPIALPGQGDKDSRRRVLRLIRI